MYFIFLTSIHLELYNDNRKKEHLENTKRNSVILNLDNIYL